LRKFDELEADPSKIGNIPKPPFVRLPDPERLFIDRAARFRQLAAGHNLGPYLAFLADLCELQAAIQADLAEPEMPAPELLEQAEQYEMPPLNRGGFVPDESFNSLFDRLTSAAEDLDMPQPAREALARLQNADEAMRLGIIGNVLTDTVPADAVAEHSVVAAVLQVHFARLASQLDPATLKPVGDGVCPTCGGTPSSSLIVGWNGAHGARFCSCSLCGTLWNYIRAKCTLCGSTQEVTFQAIDGAAGDVKAETCNACRGYVKVFYQLDNPNLDPIADDVASLGLDLLLGELDFRRGAVNPFLIGY
jgi:FdhE protein